MEDLCEDQASCSGQLKILHVTDIHCAYDKIRRLKEWLKSNKTEVDLVLVSGDIANVPYELCHSASAELRKEHDDHVQRIVTEFAAVTERVYFIPGNHDPISWFDTTTPADGHLHFPLNMHCRKVKVAPHLYMLGIGGSTPSYQNGGLLWEGFPYKTDAEFGKDLAGFLDPILEEEMVSLSDSYIFMTHVGPGKSSTAEVHSPSDAVIYAGSDSLYDYLMKVELQGRTVLHVHGHTHDCPGVATLGSVPVVNPGPLLEGHFGLYTLNKVTERKPTWKLSCTALHRLS